MTQTRTIRCWMLVAAAVVGSASLAWAQGQGSSSAPAATTTRAAEVAPRVARTFYWWPVYRGMLPVLTNEQAEKLDGIAASYGRLTRGLYLALRAKKLSRAEYGKRHRELRDDIERAKRAVLRPE